MNQARKRSWPSRWVSLAPTLADIDAVVTDPPYGVGLTAKANKWVANEGDGYTSTDDNPDEIQTVCVPAIELCRVVARSVAVTPGTRCAFLYPAPDALGGIYNRNGAGSGKWGFECLAPVLFYGKDPYLASGQGRRPNSWEQPGTDFADKLEHPCPKPPRLSRWLVNRASLTGETVLDPFMGSGSFGVAAVTMDRFYIGIEKDPGYFEIAVQRIRAAQDQGDLFIGAAV
jgi:DNA modification methylase